jgi:hypothetical protein
MAILFLNIVDIKQIISKNMVKMCAYLSFVLQFFTNYIPSISKSSKIYPFLLSNSDASNFSQKELHNIWNWFWIMVKNFLEIQNIKPN